MSLLNQTIKKIMPPDQRAIKFVKNKLSQTMTNPDGLGELQNILLRYVGITGQIKPEIPKKLTIITCADHGIAEMNVSAYPQETTAHMTRNYLVSKGAVANSMSNFCGSDMIVVDMGIKAPVDDIPGLIDHKIAPGTNNCAKGPAMTREQAIEAIETGIQLVNTYANKGYCCFLPGEMGIANTTSSAAIVACLCNLTPKQATGRGTNISDERLAIKIDVVKQALTVNKPDPTDGLDVMSKIGGFELACITGIILGAAANHCFVVLDGFNTGSAALVAQAICPEVTNYLMASHLAAEPAHNAILKKLNLSPYMDLKFRLGEATGSSIAVNILDCAIKTYHSVCQAALAEKDKLIKPNIPTTDFDTKMALLKQVRNITLPDEVAREKCRNRIDNLTKPIYSLGKLENIAENIAGITRQKKPTQVRKKILVITPQESCSVVQHRLTQAFASHANANYHFTSIPKNLMKPQTLSFSLLQGICYGSKINNIDVLGIACCENHPKEICGTFSLTIKQQLCNFDNSLRYSKRKFLSLEPNPYLCQIAFMAGIAIGAASKGILVLSDDIPSSIAIRYALLLAPTINPYIMFVCPDYLNLHITTGGGCICALGMKLIDASLQMLKDMKTFAEADVAIANDGPGAKIQTK